MDPMQIPLRPLLARERFFFQILTPSLTVYKLDTLGLHSEVQPVAEIAESFKELLGPLKGRS